MKKLKLTSIIACGIMLACASNVYAQKVTTNKERVFYLQTAQAGAIHHKGEQQTLTLNKPAKNIIWFTASPYRKTGNMTIDRLLTIWTSPKGAHFNKQHPNATITFTLANKQSKSLVAELYKPTYNERANQLMFHFKPLTNNAFTKSMSNKTIKLKHVSVFIDGCFEPLGIGCW